MTRRGCSRKSGRPGHAGIMMDRARGPAARAAACKTQRAETVTSITEVVRVSLAGCPLASPTLVRELALQRCPSSLPAVVAVCSRKVPLTRFTDDNKPGPTERPLSHIAGVPTRIPREPAGVSPATLVTLPA